MSRWFRKLRRGESRRTNNKRNTARRLWKHLLEPLEIREYLSPAAPVVTGFSSDSGVAGDRITSDNSLLVTGTADPGNSVNVFFNSVLQGNVVAAADRSWSFLATAKPDGIYSITATAQDSGGATSSASAAFAVTIDTIAPLPASISGFVGDTGVVGDQVTSDATLTITGAAEAGSSVRLFVDGVSSATTTTAANGTWSVAAPAMAEGTHSVTATAQDVAGNTSAASAAFDITVDLTAPAAPTIGGFAADSGVAGDSITNDNTPTLAGTAEPGSSVTVFFSGASQGTTLAASDGAWSFTAAPLDGLYNVTTTAQDPAGNTSSPSAAFALVIDTAAPAPPTLTGFSSDSGVTGDGITNDTTLSITGVAEPGGTVAVFADGVLEGSVAAATNGAWSLVLSPKSQGTHTVTATAQDVTANTSSPSSTLVVVVDTTSPVPPVITSFATDTGAIGDNLTSDSTLSIVGSAEAGSTVTVFFDGAAQGATTAANDGAWKFDAPSRPDGVYNITAIAQDAAGNSGGGSNTLVVTIDTTAPAATVTSFANDTGVPGDNITSDNTLAISGTAEPASVITVFLNGAAEGAVTTAASGSWVLQAAPKPDGVYVITAAARDSAGNTGPASGSLTVTIDTTAPDDPTILGFGAVSCTGVERLTNTNTLNFFGAAPAGSAVSVFLNGINQGASAADGVGTWSFLTEPLPDGEHTATVIAQDAAGNISGVSNACVVTIDATEPIAPQIISFADDTGVVGDKVTRDNTLTITGTAEANSRVAVFFGGVAEGTTTADAAGNWSFNASTKADGSYTITASAQDAAGNTSSLSNECIVTIDTTGPTTTTITAFSDDTGVVGDKVTRDNTLTITGTAEANSRVTVFFGGVAEGTTTANAAGNWSFSASAKADGSHTITASAQDAASNTGSLSNECMVTIDTTGSTATTITAFSDDTGVVGDKVTRDNTLRITGTAEANSRVTVFFGGVAEDTTTADAAGNWSFSASAKADGSYTITASAQDAAGNTGSLSDECLVTIDTTAPAATAITAFSDDTGVVGDKVTRDNTLTITGTAEPNSRVTVFFDGVAEGTTTADAAGNWSFDASAKADGSYTITASAQDAAGNTGSLSNEYMVTIDTTAPAATAITAFSDDTGVVGDKVTRDNTLTITGTAEANSRVTVFFDGVAEGTTTADAAGNWSFDASAKADDSYTITASAQDAAGNTSDLSNECVVTIDTTAPAAPTIIAFLDDTGTAGDKLTRDNTLSIGGGAGSGEVVTVMFDGVVQGTTLANGAGEWTYHASAKPDGMYTITAIAEDAAGNISAPSNECVVTIDTVGPAAPTVVGIADDSNIVGDFVTNDNTLTVTGAAAPDATIEVSFDGVPVGATTASAAGEWSFDAPTLPDGVYLIAASALDAAGNTTPSANSLEVTIDTVAPLQPFVTMNSDPIYNGSAEPNSTLTAYVGTSREEVTTTASDGSWSISLSQAPTSLSVTFDATDLAGNRSPSVPGKLDNGSDCGSPIVDTDFDPVTGSGSTNSLRIVRERAYESSPDLATYGAPGTHTYVQSLLFHTRDEESDREVIAATITFSPGVTIVATISSSKLLGGTKHDGVGSYSDAVFGIFDNPDVSNPNWNKYSGSPRGLDAAKDHRFEVINDGGNGEPAQIELQFPTTTGPDQSRVIVDYGDCWAANPTVSVETHATSGRRVRKYAPYEHFRIGDKTYRSSTTAGAPLHYVVPTIERISQDSGANANDHVTGDTTLDLFGRSSPGARVSIELDGQIVDEVLADGEGRWSYLLPTLGPGNYHVRATSNANGSSLASSAFLFSVVTSDVLG